MSEVKKLTKAQKEFFTEVTKELLTLMLVLGLGADDEDQILEIQKQVEVADIGELTQIVGERYLEHVTLAELKRVQKYTKSEEYLKVQRAGAAVGEAVKDSILRAIEEIISAKA